jgi:hypothetical protein
MQRSATVIRGELVPRPSVTSLRRLVFLLFCTNFPFSFFFCYSKSKISFSLRRQTMPGKAFSQMFGDREICPDGRRLVSSFLPYARLNVNHVRESMIIDLVQQRTNLYTRTRTLMLHAFILSIFAFKHDTS